MGGSPLVTKFNQFYNSVLDAVINICHCCKVPSKFLYGTLKIFNFDNNWGYHEIAILAEVVMKTKQYLLAILVITSSDDPGEARQSVSFGYYEVMFLSAGNTFIWPKKFSF